VRVTAGNENCPPAALDERATLSRIGAEPDVRLACQLRPQGNVSVVPLVRTARPVYRQTAPQRGGEREIVVLYCDFRNRNDLAADHLPQDLLYVLTLYVEGIGNAVRAHGGTLSSIGPDSICALFGIDQSAERAAQQALQAAGAIEGVLSDLNNRLDRRHEGRLKVAVSIHAGRAAVGEVGSAEAPLTLAIGEAVTVVNGLRKAAADRDKAFAISEQVYREAGLEPPPHDRMTLPAANPDDAAAVAYLSNAAPLPSPTWTLHGEIGRRAMLRRLWTG
jgi:adenylate cyclase